MPEIAAAIPGHLLKQAAVMGLDLSPVSDALCFYDQLSASFQSGQLMALCHATIAVSYDALIKGWLLLGPPPAIMGCD